MQNLVHHSKKMPDGQLLLSILLMAVGAAHADVNCNVLPDIRTFQTCCSMPKINFEPYQRPCGQYLNRVGGPMSPCLYECIFNATNVLNGSTLNLNNVRSMLTTTIQGDSSFMSVFMAAYQNCSNHNDKILEFVNRKRPSPPGMKICSTLSMMYVMCAHKLVFLNCPSTNWNTGKACMEAKEFVVKCKFQPTKINRPSRGMG